MSIEVGGPSIIDLVRGGLSWEVGEDCCDLCREKAQLYRLLRTTDALCARCFGMWHG